jgi:hypothetical protein
MYPTLSFRPIPMTDRSDYLVVRKSLHESSDDDDYVPGTPEERWNMMWQLVVDAWIFSGKTMEELDALKGSPRRVARLIRRSQKDS